MNITDRLLDAQKYAMSIRPQVGGFPVIAEVLRRAGVRTNKWTLPSCQSIYYLIDGIVVQQGTPLVTGTEEIVEFNRNGLIAAIRADQQGLSTFPEFLSAAWKAGVVWYEVDLIARRVTYIGATGETYYEDYPAAHLE